MIVIKCHTDFLFAFPLLSQINISLIDNSKPTKEGHHDTLPKGKHNYELDAEELGYRIEWLEFLLSNMIKEY